MSLGATYYYFPSKESIVAAYYDHVQDQHRQRAFAAFAAHTTLKERLRAAYHTKLDVMREDQGLLRALFRFGGDPAHPLSWFGPASRAQRQASMEVFAAAIEGERLPDDVQAAAPTLLWTLHMGVLLYFLYDSSEGFRKTRRLVDAAVEFRDRRQAHRHVAADASGSSSGVHHLAGRRPARDLGGCLSC